MVGSDLALLSKTAAYMEGHGFARPGLNRITTWAILVAHAATPADHWQAQEAAQNLLDSLGVEKQLHDFHPCIVLGVPAARRYFVNKGYLRQLEPYWPACIIHGVEYDDCSPECVYGVKFDGTWVHELVAAA